MILAANLLLGLVPTVILGASFAAGIDDDAHHRRMFLLIYGLWALTLAMWNWMRSAHVAWVVAWVVMGVATLVAVAVQRRRGRVDEHQRG